MSLITRALSAIGLERRAVSGGDPFWSNFASLSSGTAVTPDSAQSVAACYAAVSLISEAIGALPLNLYKRQGEDRVKATDHPLYSVLKDAPNDGQSSVEFREWMTACMLLRGNSFAKVRRGNDGQVRELLPLAPERMIVLRKGEAIGGYEYTDRDGKLERLLTAEVFHLRHRAGNDPLIGVSPIQVARGVLELAISEAAHGVATYQNGTKLSGLLSFPGKLKKEQITTLKDSWGSQYSGGGNAGRVPILEDGVGFTPLSMSLADADFVAGRQFSVQEVSRLFKVPPVLLGDLAHANFSNSVEMNRWMATHTLGRHVAAWEGAISRQLLTEAGRRIYYPAHVLEGLLRGDSAARSAFYESGIRAGWMLKSEARSLEDLKAIEGIDNAVSNQTP